MNIFKLKIRHGMEIMEILLYKMVKHHQNNSMLMYNKEEPQC